MTPDELRALDEEIEANPFDEPDGLKLDARIAIGRGCRPGMAMSSSLICTCGIGVEGVDQRWPTVHFQDNDNGYVPRYSTDPAASRVLLDEMLDAGCSVRFVKNTRGELCLSRGGQGDIWRAPTLDAAICLAWLAWKEAQG